MKKILALPYIQYLLYKNIKSRAFFKLYGIVIQEVKVCFIQFFTWKRPLGSIFRVFKYLLQSLIRLLLGRSISLSYAYTVEDRLIESILKPLIYKQGYYVDVGCNEPEFISNSFLFYRRGWTGLCIDANETLLAKHKKVRPRDRSCWAVVSDKEEELEFAYSENTGLSTADQSEKAQFEKDGIKTLSTRTVRAKTLTQIFDAYKVPREFDFLTIDIEGNDLKAMKGLDLSIYQPKLIVFEWEQFDLKAAKEEDIFQYLSRYNYQFVGYILTNAYFTKI